VKISCKDTAQLSDENCSLLQRSGACKTLNHDFPTNRAAYLREISVQCLQEDKVDLTESGQLRPLVLVEPRWFSISARGSGTRSLEIVDLEPWRRGRREYLI